DSLHYLNSDKTFLFLGGFGIVYQVHSSDGRQFALKRTLVNNAVDLANMKREITIVSSLMHKNIISYVASKVTEKEPEIHEIMLLTAYYPSSVSQVLAERQHKGLRFLEVEVLRILADVCEAVSRLHHCETPIIHRDLKIENLLIDHRKNIVLCDFGSATSRILHPAKHGTLRCQEEIEKYTTLAYRAPEMADLYSGVALGPPVDIWALGCVLYGLCFFALPFGPGSALAIQTGRYTVPTSALTSYSPQLLKLLRELILLHCVLFLTIMKCRSSSTLAIISDYMLTISAAERPDIYQVSALVFSLLGRPNPVLNVNSTNVPDWQSLSLPPTDLINVPSKTPITLHVEPRAESASSPVRPAISSTLSTPSISKSTSISPSIARRRPRASGVMSPLSSEGLPILAKPPNPPRQSNPSNNNQLEPVVETPQTIPSIDESPKPTPTGRVSGHRRGLSEASALLLKASNVRQTNSLGDLQPTPNAFESRSPEAKNDIDMDLFGAAFDAIRNQGRAAGKSRSNNSYRNSSDSGQFKDDTQRSN
ncbi:unnamed protein product, partial [Hymenolepis diminuta]|uniref:non-specific serine/threonine protein kinase n=1 Tax=Hymenolepis diminuta TaxID=6216 RepID=A0A0R3SBX0_HYMDI